MPHREGHIPEKYRDDPNLPEEERRERARMRERILRGDAQVAEWAKISAEEVAGLVSMIDWLARSLTTTGAAPGGVTLRPEAAQEVGEVIQTIVENPVEVGKAVLDGYREDIERYGGVALAADVEMAGLPIFMRIRNATRAIRAGKSIDEVRAAYRAVEAVQDTRRAAISATRMTGAEQRRFRAAFRDPLNGEILVPEVGVHALDPDVPVRVVQPDGTLGEPQNLDPARVKRLTEQNAEQPEIAGFVDPEGNYLTRDQTAEAVGAQRGESSLVDEAQETITTPDVEDALAEPVHPLRDPDEPMIELTHYGEQADELDVIDPAFQGQGRAGAERKRREAMGDDRYLPRSYYYDEGAGQRVESFFEGYANQGKRARVRVPASQIYDLQRDPDGLIEIASALAAEDNLYGPMAVQTYVEQLIRETGHIGLNDGRKVVVFERLPTVGRDAPPLPRDHRMRHPDPGPMWAVRRVDEDVARSIGEFDGATFNPRTGGDMGDSGKYAVSPFKMREQVLDHPPTAQEIAEFRMRNSDLLLGHDDVYVGGWRDGDKWYLDATMLVDDEATARRIGLATDQEGYTLLDGDQFPTTKFVDEDFDAIEAARTRWDLVNNRPSYREAIERDLWEHMTNAERAEFSRAGKRQDLWLKSYAMSPTPREWASLIELGYNSRNFYPLSHMALASFGDDAPRFTALVAALSPQRSVKENLKFATEIWENWNRTNRTADPERISMFFHPDDTTQQNAIRVLTEQDPEVFLNEKILSEGGLLSGLKVDPFYANLVGETQRVTLDTHMARGVGVEPKAIVQYRNRPIAASLRAGTDYYNRISGRAPITPREAQAAAWAPIRAMTAVAGRRVRGAELPPSVYDEFFDFPFGDAAIEQRVPREIDRITAEEGGDFGEVMRRDPALQRRIEQQAGRPVQHPEPEAPEPVRPYDPETGEGVMRARDVGGVAQRVDLSRVGEYLFGIGAVLGVPFARDYLAEAHRRAGADEGEN